MKIKYESRLARNANNHLAETINRSLTLSTLDDVAYYLQREAKPLFIYRGGNHVAIHNTSGGERVAIITD